MFEIRPIANHASWDAFVQNQAYSPFVQSSVYGNFYEKLGERSWILGIYQADTLIGGSLVVSTHAKRGNYLYMPYGPILPTAHPAEALSALVIKLRALTQGGPYHFIRMSPFWDDTHENRTLATQAGFRSAPMHVLAENTWLLDIRPDEEKLFSGMNKNHRNLIRRCERDGVRIKTYSSGADLSRFHGLLQTTARRHKFHPFSERYIAAEFGEFATHGQSLLYEAYLPNGILDSCAIILFHGNMACYRHSASRNTDKKLPTSYLVQWHAIREAKKRGQIWYNFWGIAPTDAKNAHPFFGITHFKKGFGGVQKDLLPCQDLSLSRRYWANWLVESVRRARRGF